MQPDGELITEALGAPPRALTPVSGGGYTRSGRWIVETGDGKAFVKQAEDEGSLHMIRREALVYSTVTGAFLPTYIGFADSGDRAVLALELLDGAAWPPPYPDDVRPLFDVLAEVAASPVPTGLPALRSSRRWELVSADPEPLLGLGVCSRTWLEHAVPELTAAEAAATIEGRQLCHGDIYSGNVAFVDTEAVLVDWGAAVRASPWVDVAFAALSVRAEGGTLPAIDFPDEGAYASVIAGIFALDAPRPLPAWSPPDSMLREDMRLDLVHALGWAAEALGLPPLR